MFWQLHSLANPTLIFLITSILLFTQGLNPTINQTLLNLVNPFIGTGGIGFGSGTMSPMVQVPYGMIRVGPDTTNTFDINVPFEHPGGFYYNDDYIVAFSHTHLVGAGVPDLGNLGLMPVTATGQLNYKTVTEKSSYYDKSSQVAVPGYYSVHLERYGVKVELTAATYTAVHRYTFQKGDEKYILLDASHTISPGNCKIAQVNITKSMNQIEGYMLDSGKLAGRSYFQDKTEGGVKVYFVAQVVGASVESAGVWNEKQVLENVLSTTGNVAGAYIKLNSKTQQVLIYLAISYIGVEQAKINFQSEVIQQGQLLSFEQVQEQTQIKWSNQLIKVQVSSAKSSKDNLIKFYTAVYQASMAPTTYSEAGGVYRGFDYNIHKLEGNQSAFYSDMSIWDVHRTQFPWIGFIDQPTYEDIILSMLQMYDQAGFLPKWPLAYGETSGMTGSYSTNIIVEGYLKNLLSQKIDIRKAYKGMKECANIALNYVGRYNPQDYIQRGYVPGDVETVGATLTLDYSYNDACIAELAKALNETSDYKTFYNRSQFYKNVWNSEYKFFCPKTRSGKWNCPEIWADSWDDRYVEGDAWHYRFYVPHDIPGLIELFGRDEFSTQLEEFAHRSTFFPLTSVPNPWYWGGNEPDLMSLWYFNYISRPDLTQYYIRYMMDHIYGNAPSGLPGNNDYGTMSAWFAWSALGIYPRAGSAEYFVGSPLFEEATVRIRSDCVLRIKAYNFKQNVPYVERVVWNGQTLSRPFLLHGQLTSCDKSGSILLEFYMKQ